MPNENEALETVESDAPAQQSADEKTTEPFVQSVTIERFVQAHLNAREAITIAFVSCEKRVHGVRKLPMQKWHDEFKAFLSAERR